MPKKRKNGHEKQPAVIGYIEHTGQIEQQQITDTLKSNFMPYAMSVIMSRAIPEIDGFKPSHRKLLYTMYKMSLLGSTRTKSANVVGQTMKLNPHGDMAIYDTMVRLSRGYEALLHPYVDSKGNFGKFYSRDMAWAAARYTEVKLDPICQELFSDIDKDTIDFIDNYDGTLKEPVLLPVVFPSILVNANTGIAVGMASSICPFNLIEVCQTTIGLIRDPHFDILSTLHAPDFPGGGQLIYDKQGMKNIYDCGRGSIKIRSQYTYDSAENCINITQIPPTTTVEVILQKVIDLVKRGKIREISDIRDEIGLHGLRITIDLKRNVDPNKLMQRLFTMTPLEDSFSCNFNILVDRAPKVMGIREILNKWISFRTECVLRRITFDLDKKKKKWHLLKGLEAILLDIDKIIKIIHNTEEETELIPNLIIGFGIDEEQAHFVAEVQLRCLNRKNILKRIKEIKQLEKEIQDFQNIMKNLNKIKEIIILELENVSKLYGKPRHTLLLHANEIEKYIPKEDVLDYSVSLFFTKEGYFKKITPLSMRISGEQKLKEEDQIFQECEGTNTMQLLFFTNQHQVYKAKVSEFADIKASMLGEYIPAYLNMDENEKAIYMVAVKKYDGYMLFIFENGKIAKIDLTSYETKTNRRKLIRAYSNRSSLCGMYYIAKDCELLVTSSSDRKILFHTASILPNTTKNAQGVYAMTLKKGQKIVEARIYEDGLIDDQDRYRNKIPATGALPLKRQKDIQ